MSTESASLILGNGRQLSLLESDPSGLPDTAYQYAEQAGRFTGDRLFLRNPQLYHVIVGLLARAVPYREIAQLCLVSVNTVCAVSQREGIPIETIRERIGRIGLDVAALTLEAIRDLLADPDWRKQASAKDLAIIHGIAFTNAQLALGGATARIEFPDKTPAPAHADYLQFIRNVTGTGSSAQTPAQIGDGSALPGAVIDLPTPAAAEPAKPSDT